MEEAAMVSKSKEYSQIMKGKRTKRPRQASPLALTIASTTSSTTAEGSSEFSGGGLDNIPAATTSSPSNSVELFTNNLEEEQDMANCLILLAQGGGGGGGGGGQPSVVNPTIINNKQTRLYIYQCKTCDRCFPSFQALGGHRASHKKAKSAALEKVPPLVSSTTHHQEIKNDDDDDQDHHSTTLSLQMQSRSPVFPVKTRVHECSVCGAEFSSGQALGGHMRRHRLTTTTSTTSTTSHDESSSQLDPKKSRNVIALDLNLPAPEDDHDDHHRSSESKFGFGPKEQQVIVFSASSLVDCHY